MKQYTVTLTTTIEADDEHQALQQFTERTIDHWNTGKNIEVEPEFDEDGFEEWKEDNHDKLMEEYEFDIHEMTREGDEEQMGGITDYDTWARGQYQTYLDDLEEDNN